MNLPGGLEILIIVIVVVLLFGVGRISKVAGDLGKGIREFRKGISGEDEDTKKDKEQENTK